MGGGGGNEGKRGGKTKEKRWEKMEIRGGKRGKEVEKIKEERWKNKGK